MFSHLPYKIRFVILDPNHIFNMCGPEHAGPRQWDKEGLMKRKISAIEYIDKMNKRNGFYTKLEKSIQEEGIQNPILVNAGFCQPRKVDSLPPNMQEYSTKILFCHSNGGSRLWVAVELGIKVPCIVCDFINRYSNEEEIKTEKEFYSYYKDKPKGVVFGEYGMTIKTLPLTHL